MKTSIIAGQIEDYIRHSSAKFPRKWSLFFARYNLVNEYAHIEFRTIRGKTAQGYEVGLRIALLHTALESLSKVLDKQGQLVLRDKSVSKLIRKFRGTDLEKYLVSSASGKGLKGRLSQLFESQNVADFMPIVEALRNLVFHGAFTPNSIGFTTNQEVRLLLDLISHVIIDVIEEELLAHAIHLGIVDNKSTKSR